MQNKKTSYKPKNKRLTLLILLLSLFKIPVSSADESESTPLNCLAKNIFHEARGEGKHGMMMVGHVVLNRVKSKQFSDTICGVIYQPKQFSWVHKKKKHTVSKESKEWKISLEAAKMVLERSHDPTKGSLYFYSSSSIKKKPAWVKKKEVVTKVGNHVFLR